MLCGAKPNSGAAIGAITDGAVIAMLAMICVVMVNSKASQGRDAGLGSEEFLFIREVYQVGKLGHQVAI